MKINILYFFLFFGYFLNAKFTDFYYDLYDIDIFNETKLYEHFGNIVMRTKVKGKTNINIQFKTIKNSYDELNTSLIYFSKFPDEDDISSHNKTDLKVITLYKQSYDSSYDFFSLNTIVPDDSSYLMFVIHGIYFQFISIYVSRYYNISYNQEYVLNTTDLNNDKGRYLFILKKENEKNGILKLKINKEAYPDRSMLVNIHGYNEEPINKDDYNDYIDEKELLLDSKFTDKKYSTYGYLFNTIKNASYLIFNITIFKEIDYFSIYVCPDEEDDKSDESEQSEEGDDSKNSSDNSELNSKAFIVLIVNISIVVFLVFLYCIFKKCDCCD